jgi:hypothetical protein
LLHWPQSDWRIGVSDFIHIFRDRQVLDGATLAAVWVGNITSWDDAAILNLNPTLVGKLPTAQIALSFSSGDVRPAIAGFTSLASLRSTLTDDVVSCRQ